MDKMHETKFTVEGSGQFPTDMLRYDECHPASEADSALMENWRERRKINLVARTHRPNFKPTIGRWNSFTWRVVEVEGQPA